MPMLVKARNFGSSNITVLSNVSEMRNYTNFALYLNLLCRAKTLFQCSGIICNLKT